VDPSQHGSARAPRRPLCVIDHVGNAGGGVKYALRMLDRLRLDWEVELCAQPAALARYRQAAGGVPLALRVGWPLNLAPVLADQSPRFSAWLAHHAQEARAWSYQVRPPAQAEAGVCFFPWLHRHDLSRFGGRGLGVFHDAIFFEMPELIGPGRLALETDNLRTWFERLDRIVVTSAHTKRRLLRVAGEPWADRISVIHVADSDGGEPLPLPGRAATQRFGRYLVMPAVASPHKNHRVLLAALRRSRGPWKLVLTGAGTEAHPQSPLGRLIAQSGLGDRVCGLGHVAKALVTQLVADAEALVMPTLGEGGGSFPVCEAIVAGTPVIASNLDVIAEQLERMGAQATLFDPRNEDELVAALDGLARDPEAFRRVAREQVGRLRLRTWDDVAREFTALLARLYPDR
jgi:glycosyltransferase involved in cell wall biosynthesis